MILISKKNIDNTELCKLENVVEYAFTFTAAKTAKRKQSSMMKL
jgi:hypothetical protein